MLVFKDGKPGGSPHIEAEQLLPIDMCRDVAAKALKTILLLTHNSTKENIRYWSGMATSGGTGLINEGE